MNKSRPFSAPINRRDLLRKGMAGLGIAGLTGNVLGPSLFGRAAEAAASGFSDCVAFLVPVSTRSLVDCAHAAVSTNPCSFTVFENPASIFQKS